MNENQSRTNKFVQDINWLIIVVLVIASIFGIYSIYNRFNSTSGTSVKVNIDKIAIINKVQNLSRLETVRQTIQRDVQVELDLGDFKIFNFKLAENKRTQKIAVTGYVTAGVGLGSIGDKNVVVDGKNVTINIPASKILGVSILEDKTTLLKDDFTPLFKVQDVLDDTRRRELNEYLQNQAIKQSKTALVGAACDSKILDQARDNAKTTIAGLFSNLNASEVKVNIEPSNNCTFDETGN